MLFFTKSYSVNLLLLKALQVKLCTKFGEAGSNKRKKNFHFRNNCDMFKNSYIRHPDSHLHLHRLNANKLLTQSDFKRMMVCWIVQDIRADLSKYAYFFGCSAWNCCGMANSNPNLRLNAIETFQQSSLLCQIYLLKCQCAWKLSRKKAKICFWHHFQLDIFFVKWFFKEIVACTLEFNSHHQGYQFRDLLQWFEMRIAEEWNDCHLIGRLISTNKWVCVNQWAFVVHLSERKG